MPTGRSSASRPTAASSPSRNSACGDGSGFPYASIYLIDTEHDAWVSGTPIRVMHESEEETLAQCARGGAPAGDRHGWTITASCRRGRVVVSNPSSEVVGRSLYEFASPPTSIANWRDRIWTLRLTPLPLPEPIGCQSWVPLQGFRLVLTNPGRRGAHHPRRHRPPRLARLPAGLCDRRRGDLFPRRPRAGDGGALHVISQGFEGPDRRFLAVATSFQDY